MGLIRGSRVYCNLPLILAVRDMKLFWLRLTIGVFACWTTSNTVLLIEYWISAALILVNLLRSQNKGHAKFVVLQYCVLRWVCSPVSVMGVDCWRHPFTCQSTSQNNGGLKACLQLKWKVKGRGHQRSKCDHTSHCNWRKMQRTVIKN